MTPQLMISVGLAMTFASLISMVGIQIFWKEN
jgi:hypothetical protein